MACVVILLRSCPKFLKDQQRIAEFYGYRDEDALLQEADRSCI